ncbi:TetR family transcriptional regulator [Streptomyces sp. NPDC057638]|uniref:TetR family transcriptional regulator n=1 Tax=Streptomyces sp. NPDC057638 TaxID=3346190 RepID=UPI00368F2D0D
MTERAESAPGVGVRERKKRETRLAIHQAAMELFATRGFDQVSVAQVAEAAHVSKVTVFNYFPTKEDLVMVPLAERVADPGRPVRERAPGQSAVGALRREFLADLDRRAAHVGLDPGGLGLMRVVRGSAALTGRALLLERRNERRLAETLAAETGAAADDITSLVVAATVMAAMRAVVAENWRRLVEGDDEDAVHADAVADAERAFAILEEGLGAYAVRKR